jgi:hypothetical protein
MTFKKKVFKEEVREEPKEQAEFPKSVKMKKQYGFIDDSGKSHMWYPGQIIDDEDSIKVLIARKAPLEA